MTIQGKLFEKNLVEQVTTMFNSDGHQGVLLVRLN